MHKLIKKTVHKSIQYTLCFLLLTASFFIVGCSQHSDTNNRLSSALSQDTSSDDPTDSTAEEESETISSGESSQTSASGKDSPSKPSSPSNSKNDPGSNPSSSSQPSSSSGSSSSAKKDYFDVSGLTGTQADVGKVVGYSSMLAKDIVVVSVVERTTSDGRKVIQTNLSDGTVTKVVECEYCHKFPCPTGGGKRCPKYDPLKDATVTCQICGRPRGDGYNGTCEQLIDWANGGKVSCNHYD